VSLRGRLAGVQATEAVTQGASSRAEDNRSEIIRNIHYLLIEEMGSELDVEEEDASLRLRIERKLHALLDQEPTPLSAVDKAAIVADVADNILGYGPIDPLLKDPTITEVMVNNPSMVFIERAGRIIRTDKRFIDEGHLLRVIDKIVSRVGRRIDESSPMVDARLPDGSRVTTLLNVVSAFVPQDERIVTIEDAAELRLHQEHVLRLEARPSNIEGKGQVTIRDLVRNSLRMRPDRIIVGEVRGGEALDMLQAMNTGHDGSLSTVHANSPRDALSRLETMVLMSGVDLPVRAIREQASSALDLLVHLARLRDGTRRVVAVSEVEGMEGETIVLQDIFQFDYSMGIGEDGRFRGRLKSTGLRPRFMRRLEDAGIALPSDTFDYEPPERR